MRLIPKSRVASTNKRSVATNKASYKSVDIETLIQSRACWDSLCKFREDRNRNKRYTFGNQWGDIVIDENGKSMTEESYIISQGSIPMKNNLIRRLVRTVTGIYRNQNKEPMCVATDRDEQRLGETMSTTLQYNWRLNKMSELNARLFEEFLIGGFVALKETYGWRNDKMDCWTDTPHPGCVFFDGAMQDFRYWDLSVIGEIHDCSFNELCSIFAKNDDDYQWLKSEYHFAANKNNILFNIEKLTGKRSTTSNTDFLIPTDDKMCRVIEVWKQEQKPRLRCHDYLNGDYYKEELDNKNTIIEINNARIREGIEAGMTEDDIPLIEYEWFIDNYWTYRFMTPFGHILSEGESPYAHKSHPYTIKIYPFIDGEVHSFVSDVIDQQRYVNRLVTLNDFILRASAKGVLMFPEELLPDGYNMDEIASEWIKPNGFILYKSKPGVAPPTQIANNSSNIGIHEMLRLQMSLMEEITGVNGALQGKPGFSGMSASLYAQQQQNASSSLIDILETFSSFVRESALKKVKNIQQFYDTKKTINVSGKNSIIEYDPEKIQDVEFDLSIIESQSTPTIRAIGNDLLLQLHASGAITVEQLLECGDFPFADTLLQSIRAQKELLEQGQPPGDIGLESLQGINADPKAMDMLKQYMNN